MSIQTQAIRQTGIGYVFFFKVDGLEYRGSFTPARNIFSDEWKIVSHKNGYAAQADVSAFIKAVVSAHVAA